MCSSFNTYVNTKDQGWGKGGQRKGEAGGGGGGGGITTPVPCGSVANSFSLQQGKAAKARPSRSKKAAPMIVESDTEDVEQVEQVTFFVFVFLSGC